VRAAAREPLAGEIRLQWWHEVLSGAGRGDVDANPVAAALRATIARHGLAQDRLRSLIEARRFDLHDEPMPTLGDLEAYANDVSSGLIALAGQIIDPGRAADDALLRHAGCAYAIAGLLRAFPVHAARGQVYVPADVLKRHGADRQDVAGGRATLELRAALAELRLIARRHLGEAQMRIGAAAPALIPALLPVAPVAALLARMERRGYDPFVPDDIAQWRRQWLIWRGARRPARIFG
jgi:phytoene synthase